MNFFDQITTLENFEIALSHAQKSKKFKHQVLNFNKDSGTNLIKLLNEVKSKTYTPTQPKKFSIIEHEKQREITASHFKDLIVQHAIYQIINPHLDKKFSHYSFASRKQKGTHRAALQTFEYYKHYEYTLKIDIKKFFPSVDQTILFEKLSNLLKCKDTINLIKLFYENETALPIGFLLSQLFANVYLNSLDHFLHHRIKLKFVRYVDDVVIFSNDNSKLVNSKKEIENYIIDNLNLKFSKWNIIPNRSEKLNCYGYVYWDKKIWLRDRTLETIKNKFKKGINRKQIEKEMNGHCQLATRGCYHHLLNQLENKYSNGIT